MINTGSPKTKLKERRFGQWKQNDGRLFRPVGAYSPGLTTGGVDVLTARREEQHNLLPHTHNSPGML